MDPTDLIWPADDPESEVVREVYARYGLAMYSAQVLEHAIVNMVIVLRFMPTRSTHQSQESWEAAFDDFCIGEFGKTLGNMLRTLEKLNIVPEPLIERLRRAKEIRDVLAHRFFRKHDWDFMKQDGRAEMIVYCERAVEEFKAIDAELDTLCLSFLNQFGLTDECIKARYAEMLAQAQQRNGPADTCS